MHRAIYTQQCHSQRAISISDCIICHLLCISIHHTLNHPRPLSPSLSVLYLSFFTSLSNYHTQTNISPDGRLPQVWTVSERGGEKKRSSYPHMQSASELEVIPWGIDSKSSLSGESIAVQELRWTVLLSAQPPWMFLVVQWVIRHNAFSNPSLILESRDKTLHCVD